jgi:hypothetical protein
MILGKSLLPLNEDVMNNATQSTAATPPKTSFNFNKLQAVACIAGSAAISTSLIAWAFSTFL